MNIHEYQAKSLVERYGVPIPRGGVAKTAEAAEAVARELGAPSYVVKAQVHAGGRGKAGGVRLSASPAEVRTAADALLGSRLVTHQTGPEGKTVGQVYVEEGVGFTRELYLAALVDRSAGRVALIASAEGGEDIEEKAAQNPAAIARLVIDPDEGFVSASADALARQLGFSGVQVDEAVAIMQGIYQAFLECDASLVEINPLVVTNAGDLLALDVKMALDDNALFRHQDLEALRDQDEVEPTEMEAKRFELNFVKLEGNIGVMVNGAGLALATIDLLKHHGGAPADFMDVRPSATRDQVAAGFRMLLDNPKVEAILVNVYGGGILRCDTIAQGIAHACRAHETKIPPVVVRAAGTNSAVARDILVGQGIPVAFAADMAEGASKVVAAVKKETV